MQRLVAPQAQDLATDRPHRHRWRARHGGAPGAEREDDRAAQKNGAVGEREPDRPSIIDSQPCDAVRHERDPSRGDRRTKGSVQRAGVHRVVSRHVHGAAQPRCQRWLTAPGVTGGESVSRQAQLAVERVQFIQRPHVVRVEADLQRAVGAQPDLDTGRGFQLGDERRIPPQRVLAQAQQRFLAIRCLGDRREHAGRGERGTRAEVLIHHGHRKSTLDTAPGNAQSDQAAARDHDVRQR